MKVIRKDYISCVQNYILELTDEYVKEMNEYIQICCLDKIEPLTDLDIVFIMNKEPLKRFDTFHDWKTPYNATPYAATLRDFVEDCVSDDLFEYYVDTDYIETKQTKIIAFSDEE